MNDSNICGDCIQDYYGSYDVTNSACVEKVNLLDTPKNCPNDCHGNGTCTFKSISIGKVVDDCSIVSSSCYSSCFCDSDLVGRDCSLTNNELENIKNIQIDKLTSLANMATSSLLNIESLGYLIPTSSDMVKSLSIDTSISSDVIDMCNTIISSTVDKAYSFDLPSTCIMVYADAISSITPLMLNNDNSISMNEFQDMYENFVDTLTIMTVPNIKSLRQIVISETDNMITMIKPLDIENSISSLDFYQNRIMFPDYYGEGIRRLTSVKTNITLGMSVTRAYIYRNLYKTCTNCTTSDTVQNAIASNPLRLNLNCSEVSSSKVIIEIQNFENQKYTVLKSKDAFRTVCKKGIAESYVYKCSYPDSNTYEVFVDCDGKANSVYNTKCPNRTVRPTCDIVTSKSLGSCSLLSSNSTTLFCSCTVCESSTNRRLELVNDDKLDSFRISSVTEYVFEQYISTMESSETVTAQDFISTLTVSLSFAAIWAALIVIVSVRSFRERAVKKKAGDRFKSTSVIPNNPDTSGIANDFNTLFKTYLISYFPSVYKDDMSLQQVLTTIFTNHQYFSLLTNSRTNLGYTNRWVDAFHLATIISANMFILAMLFDIRMPTDDGSCEAFTDKHHCLQKRSAFSTYCTWTEEGCQFQSPKITIMAIVTLGWLQLLLSAPFKACINFVFDNVVCAASKQLVEEQIRSTTIVRRFSVVKDQLVSVTRRMSVAIGNRIRRMSNNTVGASRDGGVQDMGAESKRLSRRVTSTMTVNPEFIQMRKSVIEHLAAKDRNHHHHHHSSSSSNNNNNNDDDDDDVYRVQVLCSNFVGAFIRYRKTLDAHRKSEFDKKWAFLHHDYHSNSSSMSISISNGVVPIDVVNSDYDEKFQNMISIIYSEIMAVYKDSNKALGNHHHHHHYHHHHYYYYYHHHHHH